MFKRIETDTEITIIFKYLPLLYPLIIVMIIPDLFPEDISGVISVIIKPLLFIYFICNIKAILEIRKAMKVDGVHMLGSKFSFSNPLRAIIKK
jgi:hypothetical protein